MKRYFVHPQGPPQPFGLPMPNRDVVVAEVQVDADNQVGLEVFVPHYEAALRELFAHPWSEEFLNRDVPYELGRQGLVLAGAG